MLVVLLAATTMLETQSQLNSLLPILTQERGSHFRGGKYADRATSEADRAGVASIQDF